MTIRDLRRRWPEAEAAPRTGEEIVITRDSEPVAKLVRMHSPEKKRPRWNAQEHARWLKRMCRGKSGDFMKAVREGRAERDFGFAKQ